MYTTLTMPTLTERLETDYKTALKAQDRRRVDAIRMIKADIQRVAIEQRRDSLEDKDVIHVITKQAKQRRETLDAAKQSGRKDIETQTAEELAILNAYLPTQLAPDQLKALIDEAVKTVGANQGQVMKFVMGKAAGAADGKVVSQLVAERLKQAAS